MSAQLVTKFKRADPSRTELTMNRASQRATSISCSPTNTVAWHRHDDFFLLCTSSHLTKNLSSVRHKVLERETFIDKLFIEPFYRVLHLSNPIPSTIQAFPSAADTQQNNFVPVVACIAPRFINELIFFCFSW
jgi:hypothetical protein